MIADNKRLRGPIREERPMRANTAAIFASLRDAVGADRNQSAIADP